MNDNTLKKLLAASMASIALGTTAHAQSADALIDKLVQKGILTSGEAQDLREESDKNFSQAYAVKSGMSDWVQALKFNGDVRGRYERFDAENPLFTTRQRMRYRVRFGVVAQLADQFEAGFRLTSDDASGTFGGDPLSGNSTFQDNASKKFMYVDLAYGKWTPLSGPDWFSSFTIGKMENPFSFSDMVFDPDYTPEGVAGNLAYSFNDHHTLKLTGAYMVVDELSGNVHDPSIVGAQARWDAAWTPKLSTTVGAAYLDLFNPALVSNTSVPNGQHGNAHSAAGTLIYGYHPFVVDASGTYMLDSFPMYPGAFPIHAGGDYMYNSGAPSSADNYGYSLGVQFGKAGKKKAWELSYTYKWLGAEAWWEEVVDSDFGAFYRSPIPNDGFGTGYGAGTNVKGHIVRFAYSPSDSFTLSVKWFLTELIHEFPAGSQSQMSRIQLDATWKF